MSAGRVDEANSRYLGEGGDRSSEEDDDESEAGEIEEAEAGGGASAGVSEGEGEGGGEADGVASVEGDGDCGSGCACDCRCDSSSCREFVPKRASAALLIRSAMPKSKLENVLEGRPETGIKDFSVGTSQRRSSLTIIVPMS